MDIAAAAPNPTTPPAGGPAGGTPVPAPPGGTFASVFATMVDDMGDVTVPPMAAGEAGPVVSITDVEVPDPRPAGALPAVPVADLAPPSETGAPGVAGPDRPAAQVPVAVAPGRRPRSQAPPESPPPKAAPAEPEREAVTTASNAPATPLDLSSEAADPDLKPAEEATAIPPAVALALVPLSAVPTAAPAPKGAGTIESVGATTRSTIAETIPDAGIVSADGADGIAPEPAGRAAIAPALPVAPDLDVVPQVTSLPNPTVAEPASVRAVVANVPVARIAAASGAPAPAKAEPPTVRAADAKTAALPSAAESAPATSDDASAGDDAPKDPTPGAAPAPAVTNASATERPEEGLRTSAVDRHLVVRQVADRIESLAAGRAKDGVTIHLQPRDLGTLTLVVKGLSSALDVQIQASDDRVRQSLDASRPELAQALAPRGLSLRDVRVSFTPAPGSGGASTLSDSNGGSGANGNGRPRSQSPSATTFAAARAEKAAVRASRASGRGVDLLV